MIARESCQFKGRQWHFYMFVISGLAGGQTTPFFSVTIDFVVNGEVGCLLIFEALLNMKASANTVQPAATSTQTQFDAEKYSKKM